MKSKKRKAFTLVELVVVIAILAILSSIAVPRFSGFSEKAKIKADEASLATLNKATSIYAAVKNISDKDIFEGITSDEDQARMGVLVENGLLNEKIKPQQKDKKFVWGDAKQLWTIANSDGTGKTEEEIAAEKAAEELAMKYAKEIEDAIKLGFMKKGETTFSGTIGKGYIGPSNLEIPDSIGGVAVTSIDAYAFKENKLTSVKLPKGLTKIEEGVFSRNNLTSIDIPDSVTEIGAWAFDLNYLTEVTIPKNVTSIGYHAFYWNGANKNSLDLLYPNRKPGTYKLVLLDWRPK